MSTIRNITSDTTIDATDNGKTFKITGAVTLTVPSPTGITDFELEIVSISGAITFDGYYSGTMAATRTAKLFCDGTAWTLKLTNEGVSAIPVPVTEGGTGVTSLASLKTAMSLDNVILVEKTPVNAVAASKSLTVSGVPADNDTVTIGGQIYKWANAIAVLGAKASKALTFSGLALNSETVTMGSQVYTFKTTLTGTYATGTLTLTGVVKEGERFTIGADTFEFDADGVITPGRIAVDLSAFMVRSQGTLTLGGAIPADGDTCTIGATTYRFKNTMAQINDVQRGISVDDCIDNLVAAVNGAAGAGTLYYTGTTANSLATAAKTSGTTMVVTNIVYGTVGDSTPTTESFTDILNVFDAVTLGTTTAGVDCPAADADGAIISEYNTHATETITATQGGGTTVVFTYDSYGVFTTATTSSMANGSFGAATLGSGVATVANEVLIGINAEACIDNLVLAVTAGAQVGVKYSTGTVANSYVTGAKTAADTFTCTALAYGDAGNAIAIAETLTNAAWASGATFLSGGEEAEAANDVLIGATAELSIDNLVLAINAGAGAGTNYGLGTIANAYVTASKTAADTMTVTNITKGVIGNSTAISESGSNTAWAGGATALSGGVDGTVGIANETCADGSYIYHCIATNTTAGTNWRKIDLGSAY